MSEELISKKELLELKGISYGQLYRWKRKNLIPDEWFIRKSTFTGQETFFPKQKVLARVDKIINLKENLSLDDVADVFSINPNETLLSSENIMKHHIVSDAVVKYYMEQIENQSQFNFEKLLSLFILDKLLLSGEISLDEGKNVVFMLQEHYKKLDGKNYYFAMIRKLGVSTCFLMSNIGEFHLEQHAKFVAKLNLTECAEQLKTKLMGVESSGN